MGGNHFLHFWQGTEKKKKKISVFGKGTGNTRNHYSSLGRERKIQKNRSRSLGRERENPQFIPVKWDGKGKFQRALKVYIILQTVAFFFK